MEIGIPRERKAREGRVALTPEACAALVAAGHRVVVEQEAGTLSGYNDDDYIDSGCEIAPDNRDLYASCQLVVKVKEPVAVDLEHLRPDHLLFCYLHLAAEPALLQHLLHIGLAAYAFETLAADGRLPLLAPMSAVAGKLAVQLGMRFLEQGQGGAGVLLGGVGGTAPGRVVVIGAGVAGGHAAQVAVAVGAEVWVFDRSEVALQRLARELPGIMPALADPAAITEALKRADLLIGAVLLPGAAAPRVVSRDMLRHLPPGRVVVDISIDQGGCIEGIRPTDWEHPSYTEGGRTFVAVTNMPGAVPRTSTQALSQAILPYVLELASGAMGPASALPTALAVQAGQLIHPALKTLQVS